jgi:hypothetical protein
MLVSRKRHGACVALRWVDSETQLAGADGESATGAYRCGLISAPQEQLPAWLQRHAPALGQMLAAMLRRLARRFISAGSGCDADLTVEPGK